MILSVVLGFPLGWGNVLQAEPLDLQDVSVDAQWLAHIDVDAIKASTVVQRAYELCLADCPNAREHLNGIREKLGFDLTEDIQGITFYGNKIKKGNGVVILRAQVDQSYLLDKVQGASGYHPSTHGSYTLHTWTHKGGTHKGGTHKGGTHKGGTHKGGSHNRGIHQVTGCFHTPTELVFSQSEAEVIAALDVLDGKSPNLVGSDSSLAAEVPAGSTILVRVNGLADAHLPTKSPLVKQCHTLNFVLGEHEGWSFASAQLQTRSDEVAKQVVQVLEGFSAMAALHGQDHPEALEALNAIHVRTEGQVVTIELQESADDVWKFGQKIVARLAAAGHGKCPLHWSQE